MVAIELALAALALAAPLRVNAQYSLSKAYAGSNFFDGWDFYGAPAVSIASSFQRAGLTTLPSDRSLGQPHEREFVGDSAPKTNARGIPSYAANASGIQLSGTPLCKLNNEILTSRFVGRHRLRKQERFFRSRLRQLRWRTFSSLCVSRSRVCAYYEGAHPPFYRRRMQSSKLTTPRRFCTRTSAAVSESRRKRR